MFSVDDVNIRKKVTTGGLVAIRLMVPVPAVREHLKKTSDDTPSLTPAIVKIKVS